MAKTDVSAAQDTQGNLWKIELADLFMLGWPLVFAQLARNALFTTDVIMMGWLGPEFLAAGSLATAFFNPLLLLGVGIVGAVAPLVAQALGRRDIRSVRRTVRQGLWACVALGIFLTLIVWQIRPIFNLLGQEPHITELAENYMHFAVWTAFPSMMLIVLQCFLAAYADTRIILFITLMGVVMNAVLDWALMFGHFGLPRLELAGAGIATSLVNVLMFAAMLAYVLLHPRYRRFHLLGRFWRPDWPRFIELFRIGTPIGLTVMAEVGLFASAALLMGWLGTNELAAHAVALQCASLAFMIPLGLSQATTVRVGHALGRGDRVGIARSGWISFVVAAIFSLLACAAFIFVPRQLVGFFLDPLDPDNAVPLALAVSYLGVAALFQLVDGGQAIAAATLRGLSDTKIPMLIAIFGYWIIGFPTAYLLAFHAGLRGIGVWLGLAAGLAVVAGILTTRFAMRERLGLIRLPEREPSS